MKIKIFHSYPECSSLLAIINDHYLINATKMYLYRDMIGSVYFLESDNRKYVFKLFRREDTEQVLQSLEIISYLRSFDYPVVTVIAMPDSGAMHMMLDLPEGKRAGVLYEFLEGTVPDFAAGDITAVGQQIGRLHNLMANYPKPLIRRAKSFYIDRYIDLLRENGYDAAKTATLAEYGDRLWGNMEQLPGGFCHGDLHSGNMIKIGERFVLFDFDVASHTYPVIDAATLSDGTNYNRLDDSAYDNTRRKFERFYQGYFRERTLTDREIDAIFDFIAIRHYELNATITEYRMPFRGMSFMSVAGFDDQYEWLMRWREMSGTKSA